MKNLFCFKALLIISLTTVLVSCRKNETAPYIVSQSQEESSVSAFYTSTLSNGLVAYYPFKGNANDLSGNNNNGIIYDAMLTTDRFGKQNKAYYFNGVSAHINIPDNSLFDLVGDFSISSWFKMDQYASAYNASMLISKHDGDIGDDGFIYGILNKYHNSNQFIVFGANGIWGITPNPETYVGIGTWYNYIVTYNKARGSLKYYLNGVLVSSQYASIEMLPNDLDVTIGYSKSSYGTYLDYFNGTIDDVRIYNRVLLKAEVKYLYKH